MPHVRSNCTSAVLGRRSEAPQCGVRRQLQQHPPRGALPRVASDRVVVGEEELEGQALVGGNRPHLDGIDGTDEGTDGTGGKKRTEEGSSREFVKLTHGTNPKI